MSCEKHLSVAIVGTGPSGCYTAKYLISAMKQQAQQQMEKTTAATSAAEGGGDEDKSPIPMPISTLDIDMIDRLPTPFGLVRSGVAPDHPEVKNVENDFVKLFRANDHENDADADTDADTESKSGFHSTIAFRGNVRIGKDVSLQELRKLYDIVVLAYGCESDRKLNIEGTTGTTLKGIYSAREFVAWYNGHPDFVQMGTEFQSILHNPQPSDAKVVIIGQGNVALDCARILAKGSSGLLDTDIASHALSVIEEGVRETTVLGRRGHIQGAFTIKELRELTKLDNADFIVDEQELERGTTPSSLEELNGKGSRPKVRMDKLLRDAAAKSPMNHDKQVKLRFMLNPIKFLPDERDETKLGSVLCERTELKGEPGQQIAVGTGQLEEIPAQMALVSIGYKGIKLPDMDSSIFDERKGVVKNVHGKVQGDGTMNNLYVSGWLKRGPSGIIGTNIADAKDTVSSIMHDISEQSHTNETRENLLLEEVDEPSVGGRKGLDILLSEKNVASVDFAGYERIDEAEKDPSRLRTPKQPREKFTSVDDMLKFCQ